jgi:hypothetical protein
VDAVTREIGWLIEMSIGGCAHWWIGACGWTTDSAEAIRLARREDAEKLIAVMWPGQLARRAGVIATEHAWIPPAHEDTCRCETCKVHA